MFITQEQKIKIHKKLSQIVWSGDCALLLIHFSRNTAGVSTIWSRVLDQLERFAIGYRKIKSKVITLADHKWSRLGNLEKPKKIRSQYMWPTENVCESCDCVWFYFWLNEKVAALSLFVTTANGTMANYKANKSFLLRSSENCRKKCQYNN